MSRRALQLLAPPAARLASPLALCSCRRPLQQRSLFLATSPSSLLSLSPFLSRSYASKKKGGKKSSAALEEEEDEPVAVKGKGGKKGKGKSSFVEDELAVADTGSDEGSFDLKTVEASMDDAVDKLRVGLKAVVGRVGKVSPGASFASLSG